MECGFVWNIRCLSYDLLRGSVKSRRDGDCQAVADLCAALWRYIGDSIKMKPLLKARYKLIITLTGTSCGNEGRFSSRKFCEEQTEGDNKRTSDHKRNWEISHKKDDSNTSMLGVQTERDYTYNARQLLSFISYTQSSVEQQDQLRWLWVLINVIQDLSWVAGRSIKVQICIYLSLSLAFQNFA